MIGGGGRREWQKVRGESRIRLGLRFGDECRSVDTYLVIVKSFPLVDSEGFGIEVRVGRVDDDDVVTTGHRGKGQKCVRAPKRGGEMSGGPCSSGAFSFSVFLRII